MIQDMLTNLYTEFVSDSVILKYVSKDRIKYYDYPENTDLDKTRMIIKPMSPPSVGMAGSDTELTTSFMFQIDVQSPDRKKCKEVQAVVKKIMVAFNFGQNSGGLDEYFPATKTYVDARRYEGSTKLYDTNY
jgi:hypothetical protein